MMAESYCNCNNQVDTFTKSTTNIYYVCQSDNVIQSQQVKVVCIAVNTNNALTAHRQIYAALNDLIPAEIHALQIKLLTK
jgi:stress-induced morphogen